MPTEVIESINAEISIRLVENGNICRNVIAYLHNNDDFPMHKNMYCVDNARGVFRRYINGEWKDCGFDMVYRSLSTNTELAHNQLIHEYIRKAKIDKIEQARRIEVVENKKSTLSNTHEKFRETAMDALTPTNPDEKV